MVVELKDGGKLRLVGGEGAEGAAGGGLGRHSGGNGSCSGGGLTGLVRVASMAIDRYSEQQNRSTKGQILLVSQIVAQRTKEKLWENYETKQYM